ncbi:Hypothetical predicted protein, partial [Mytilus galloprovincialis]
MSDCKDLYLCAIYVPPDKNIFYRKYDCDVFEVLQEHIEHYGALGNIAIIGDLNGRIGKANDFIGHDLLSTQLQSDISGLIDYTPDSPSERTTEDIKPANTFGRKILDLCKSSGVRKNTQKERVIKTVKCDYCNGKKRNLGVTGFNRDKPWINDECKELYRTYKRALSQFNLCRSEENRLYLNISKQRFKRMENTLKRRYKTQRGDMFSSMRRTNPKYFYRKFRRKRKTLNSNLTLDDFVTHFKNLVSKDNIIDGQVNDENYDVVYSELDRPFTEQEIDICVKKLKREKAPGYDNILNEFIKECKTVLLPLLCKLFNVILCTGWFPEVWVTSVLVPLFKKGSMNDTGNYRGISLVSHVGKLFTSVIHTRLMKWCKENSILTDAQFGFIPGYGTRDAIFALHSVIAKSLRKGKRLYCCFVDYVKAFDSVSHLILWQKMLKCGIT